ncbi:uncharacterized protein LOC143511982 isoform X6 [Brachyhypopomus gauderio]|uniref:uncharacterized protein LOC143511982 isoform X6 n=1 Tax=Brachyhypopomus gauderio TaxID=698409 RepID=UPI004043388D
MPEIRWYGRGPPRLQGQEDDMQNTAVGQRCLHAFKTRVLRSRGRDSSPNLCTSRTIHVPYIREKDPERRSRRESPLSPRVPYASCSGECSSFSEHIGEVIPHPSRCEVILHLGRAPIPRYGEISVVFGRRLKLLAVT